MGQAKSYAGRMFEFPEIGALPRDAAKLAITKPLRDQGVDVTSAGLDRAVSSLGPTGSQLIAKGMIWSPNHGDTAFTVPLFDAFMRRIMPGDDWRE
ncbi:MAG: hypothetical protein Q8M19_18355 [Reyranella sp.]|nr:hypothetical protein [Reyranella sp.]